jgi:hypothetical protein
MRIVWTWFEKFEEQEVEDSEQLLWLKASVSLNFCPNNVFNHFISNACINIDGSY